MEANKLISNIDKTNYMTFGTRTTIDSNLQLYFKNKNITSVSNTKFLGVIINKNCLEIIMLITYVIPSLKILVFFIKISSK